MKLLNPMSEKMRYIRTRSLGAALLGASMVAVSAPALAETPVEVLVEGTVHQALFAIDFVGDKGMAVGDDGEVQATEDGGKTWKQAKLPTEMAMLGLDFDPGRILVVGQAGVVLRSDAPGKWEKVDSDTDKRLFSVSANANGFAVAVGEFGAIILSNDGGSSWQYQEMDWLEIGTDGGAEPHLYSVFVGEDDVVTLVGEFGLILRSMDKGQSWNVVNMAEASLFAIEIRDDGKGFAVGQDGYALKTRDRGETWEALDVGSKAILNGVHSSSNGHVVVSAMREMMISEDGGETWRALDNIEVTTVWYVGVSASSNGVLAVGQGGRILKVGS